MDGSVDLEFAREMIDHSYDLILTSLPKKLQAEIRSLRNN